MSSKPFVAVDADTLLYSAVAACESRSIDVLHRPTGIVKSFSNRTEFKSSMKEREKPITDDFIIQDVQTPEPVENALHLIKTRAERILDNFSDCEVVFCAGDTDNFRMQLPYPTRYKANRDGTLRPIHLKEAHKYFKKKYKSVQAKGWEVDDESALLAYEALAQGRDAILISMDGDSRQFDGLRLGNYSSDFDSCQTLEFMPEMKWTDGYFDSYGLPWLAMQCAVGDQTDGLNPTYIAGKRYGEKGFYNDFHKLKTPEEIIQKLIEKYQLWYPTEFKYTAWNGDEIKADWKFMLELYWKGTTMKRKRDELPDIWKFLDEREIAYSV